MGRYGKENKGRMDMNGTCVYHVPREMANYKTSQMSVSARVPVCSIPSSSPSPSPLLYPLLSHHPPTVMDSQPQNNVSPSVPVPIRKPPPAPHILTRGPVRIPPTLQAKMVAVRPTSLSQQLLYFPLIPLILTDRKPFKSSERSLTSKRQSSWFILYPSRLWYRAL